MYKIFQNIIGIKCELDFAWNEIICCTSVILQIHISRLSGSEYRNNIPLHESFYVTEHQQ